MHCLVLLSLVDYHSCSDAGQPVFGETAYQARLAG